MEYQDTKIHPSLVFFKTAFLINSFRDIILHNKYVYNSTTNTKSSKNEISMLSTSNMEGGLQRMGQVFKPLNNLGRTLTYQIGWEFRIQMKYFRFGMLHSKLSGQTTFGFLS